MIDILIDKIKEKNNPSVVGLDPTIAMMPDFLKIKYLNSPGMQGEEIADAVCRMFLEFNKGIIDAVFDIVPAVKPQIAMYEKYGEAGIKVYTETCRYAKSKDLVVIGDIKRGDISSTAAAYAAHIGGIDEIEIARECNGYTFGSGEKTAGCGMLGGVSSKNAGCGDALGSSSKNAGCGDALGSSGENAGYGDASGEGNVDISKKDIWSEDFVTINPYMGSDGIKPFTDICAANEKGLFILVKTSNPSSSEMQDLVLSDGRRVYEAAADLVDEWGSGLIGRHGYSKVGAVVGATHKEQGAKLRRRIPHTFFLVPGYGAQGGTADDIAGFFDENGVGAIVNSSRGITAAYKKNPEKYTEKDYVIAARDAACSMRDDLRRALGI